MISPQHNTLFVHIPKCGGQSVERAFISALGLDWSMRENLLLRRNDDVSKGPPRLAHLTAKQYVQCGHLSEQAFQGMYRFSVVRDPIDRVVSAYNQVFNSTVRKTPRMLRRVLDVIAPRRYPFTSFLDDVLLPTFQDARGRMPGTAAYNAGVYWFFQPQSNFLFEKDNLLVDEIFQLQTLDENWHKVQSRAGLEVELVRRNVSRKRISKQDVSEKDLRRIRTLYAQDYDKLGGFD